MNVKGDKMVKEGKIMFQCPYCYEKFYDYDDATECAQHCCEPDDVIEIENDEYLCEMCLQEYNILEKAEQCELYHKEKDDKYYNKYKEEQSFKKLAKAANHPSQKKLS
jgi:hypothetical protein